MQRIKRKSVSFNPIFSPRPNNNTPTSLPSLTNKTVPVVVIGITRTQAVKSQQIFAEFNAASPESRPYVLAAVLDLLDSPRDYQFSAHNLGVVLHTLHPRPHVLITGTAIPDAYLNIIEPVWRAYVKEVVEREAFVPLAADRSPVSGPGSSSSILRRRDSRGGAGIESHQGGDENLDRTDGRTCWVQMSRTHPGTGPPAPGAFEEALRQLDDVFRS